MIRQIFLSLDKHIGRVLTFFLKYYNISSFNKIIKNRIKFLSIIILDSLY